MQDLSFELYSWVNFNFLDKMFQTYGLDFLAQLNTFSCAVAIIVGDGMANIIGNGVVK